MHMSLQSISHISFDCFSLKSYKSPVLCSFRSLVKAKLDVLTKAGLNCESFESVDLTRMPVSDFDPLYDVKINLQVPFVLTL